MTAPAGPHTGAPIRCGGEPELVIVVARAENRVIGRGDQLPWHLSGDLRRVKSLTWGRPLILGRRTYRSIEAVTRPGMTPLPGRRLVVLGSSGPVPDGVDLVADFEAALAMARRRARECGATEIIAFGGQRIYVEALPRAARIHETVVHCEPEGDVFFPELPKGEWRIERGPCPQPRETPDGPGYSYITWVRISS